MHPKLLVLPRGAAMVPHFETLSHPQKRFIGRKHDPSVGHVMADGKRSGGWPHHSTPEAVPTCPESDPQYHALWCDYRLEVRSKALWAADEATAKACEVDWDPTFGGEHKAPSPAVDPVPAPMPAVVATPIAPPAVPATETK